MIPVNLSALAANQTKIQIENATGLATKSNITIGDGYTLRATNYWCMIHTVDSMRAVYCIEPGKSVASGDKYNEDLANDYLKTVSNNTLSTEEIHIALGRVFLYAYTGELKTVEAYNRYVATQFLVWEVLVGQRDINFNRVSNGYTSVEKMLTNFKDSYASTVVSKYYYEYESLIKAHSKSISFGKRSSVIANATAVNAGSDGTYTFQDKNNQLKNFDATVTNGSVVSKSGNTLKIKANDGKTAVVTLKQNNVKDSGELTGFLTLTNNSTQTLAELKADPRKYYAAVKGLETGTLELIKTSEDGIVANISFTVTGNGKTYNVKTDAKGKISIPNVKAGEYTVTEVVPARYETQQSKKITVQAGKIASVSFANTLKTGAIKINKQAEDGDVSGRSFVIVGNGKTYNINTNKDGVAVLSGIPVFDSKNNKITYTISEKNVPIKYVIPANQTATLTADVTTSKTFKNVLKKFTAEVVKVDSKEKTAQGGGTLAGAVYGIYNNGKLIDTYTTDENGRFTTKEYVCGDNWTIQEISPSEGYLLDDTVYPVGAEPKKYSVEKNSVSLTVYEDLIMGDISIIKHSDDGTTGIETPETGAEFEVYLKSSGSYHNAKSTERDVLICNENGFAQSKMLPYGLYIVRQTKGWENTEWMPDFEVNISEAGKTYSYIINDAVKKSLVKIVKKDAETGKVIPVSGIGFKVWDIPNHKYVSQIINYPSQETLDTFYTDGTGTLMLPQELVYGKYELHEVQTANGYWLGTEKIPFTIDGKEKMITVEKFNSAQKGSISIVKTGDAFETVAVASSANTNENGNVIENSQTYSPIFSETKLADAVFQVIAAEDIITADGTVRAKSGDVVAELKTDKNGFAQTELLYLGKYEVREIKAPNGYVLNAESQLVELTYAGQEIKVRDTVETSFINDYQGVEINLEKYMEKDELFEIGNNLEYTNIRFGLFADEEIMAADGSSIPVDGLIEEINLGEDLTAKFNNRIPFGKYYVQEISTDEHYILNGEKYLVNFAYQGQECTTVYLSTNDGNAIENLIIRGSVEGKKVSEDDEPLANALFGLFPVGTTECTRENAYLTAKSDDRGCFSFADIPYGQYTIREIEAPTGYVLSEEIFTVNISENNQVVQITAENIKIRGNVSLIKYEENYPDNKLTGAEFTVYANKECTAEVGKLKEYDVGFYTLENLAFGKYFLKETVAPEGFVLDNGVYEFEILEDGKTVEVSNTKAGQGFINKPITGTVEITKTDISDGKPIPNCGIEILDESGNVIFQGRTDETGVVTFENLRYGNYYYREFDAPEGYQIDVNLFPFSILEDGEIVKCGMTNEKIPDQPTPKTGDDKNHLVAWLMVIGSLAIFACLAISRKKKDASAKTEHDNASLCPYFIEVDNEN